MINAKIKPAFLLYDNRSGSTFLSALLDNFDEIGVSLESTMLWSLMTANEVLHTKEEVISLIDCLYMDQKFRDWKLSQKEISKTIIGQLPISRRDLIQLILNAYFIQNKPSATCWVFKTGSPYLVRRIQKNFPDAKFVYIYRDGRAVFCSKKKNISLTSGRAMEDDPIQAAKTWVKFNQLVEKMNKSSAILNVRYESLVQSPLREIKKIYRFLLDSSSFNHEFSLDSTNYYKKIPADQLALHPNVAKPPLLSRIDAWKNEIEPKEWYLYEKIAGHELKNKGYPLYLNNEKFNFKVKFSSIFFYRLKLLNNRIVGKIRKSIYYTSHLKNARTKFLIKLENLLN